MGDSQRSGHASPRKRRTLHFRGLHVFDAVARHLSVTGAAAELGISQSAVSHQLSRLQEQLGEKLVERAGREIRLTQAGERLAASLGSAFDILEQSSAAVTGAGRPMLRIGTYSSFATGWLIPAISSFYDAHPQIDLRLTMLYDPHEVSARIADVFITSEPIERGYTAVRLFAEKLVPVTKAGGDPAALPKALVSSDVEDPLAGRDWEAFAALNDTPLPDVPMHYCSHYILSLQMVLAGMGGSLLPEVLVDGALRRGELQRLPGKALPTGQIYQIQFKYERRNDPDIVRFVAWLRSAMRMS